MSDNQYKLKSICNQVTQRWTVYAPEIPAFIAIGYDDQNAAIAALVDLVKCELDCDCQCLNQTHILVDQYPATVSA